MRTTLFAAAAALGLLAAAAIGLLAAPALAATPGCDPGTDGNDIIHCTRFDDVHPGDPGHDVIFGGEGNDSLRGGTGNDEVYGGVGQDACGAMPAATCSTAGRATTC